MYLDCCFTNDVEIHVAGSWRSKKEVVSNVFLQNNVGAEFFPLKHLSINNLQLPKVELEMQYVLQSWTHAFQLEHWGFDCVPLIL